MKIFIKINSDGSAMFVDSANKTIASVPLFLAATKYDLEVAVIDADNNPKIDINTTYSVALGSNVANQLPLAVSDGQDTTVEDSKVNTSINTDTNAFRTVINQSKIPGYLEVKGSKVEGQTSNVETVFRALLPCLLSGAAHAGTDLPEEWVSDYYTKTELDALIGDYTKFNEAITAADTATTKANEASDFSNDAGAYAGSAHDSALAAYGSSQDASNSAQTANTKAGEATSAAQTATTKAQEATNAVAGFDQHAADKIAEIEALLPSVEAYS